MRKINEAFPEMQRALKLPGRSRILHDILVEGLGAAAARVAAQP